MIKANELRIGNSVSSLGGPRRIDYLDIRDFAENRLIKPFEPIPLTPDILEKCGAVKEEGEWQFKVAIGALWISFRFNASHCYSGLGGIYLGDQIQYVHQLQNLKFALTGTELEVKI